MESEVVIEQVRNLDREIGTRLHRCATESIQMSTRCSHLLGEAHKAFSQTNADLEKWASTLGNKQKEAELRMYVDKRNKLFSELVRNAQKELESHRTALQSVERASGAIRRREAILKAGVQDQPGKLAGALSTMVLEYVKFDDAHRASVA